MAQTEGQVLGVDLNCSESVRRHSFLFALPNQSADHSTPERIRTTDVGSFYEALVAVQTVVMQARGKRMACGQRNQLDTPGAE
jgi:hypothetical protein